MQVLFVDLHHPRINLAAANHLIPGQLIAHARPTAAAETGENSFPVAFHVHQIRKIPLPGKPVITFR
jgi:hypothetical protein